MTNVYQERYLSHQNNKRLVLEKIIRDRHSNRIFSDKKIDDKIVLKLLDDISYCPSSCNRKAIFTLVINDKDLKNLLGGVLVGGVGWIHRASHIILVFADDAAYVAGDEINFMPYIDAGIIINQLYLSATDLKLKCCYVNPNVRKINSKHFKEVFGSKIFCGAFAIGL